MEIFLLIVVMVALFLIFRKLTWIKDDLNHLQKQLQDLKKGMNAGASVPPVTSSVSSTPSTPPAPAIPHTPPQIQKKEDIKTVEWPELKTEIQLLKAEGFRQKAEGRKEAEDQRPVYAPPTEQHSWFSKWLRDNPDIEKFIGENLINKIGIAVLVFGIAFFVKYAIDQD